MAIEASGYEQLKESLHNLLHHSGVIQCYENYCGCCWWSDDSSHGSMKSSMSSSKSMVEHKGSNSAGGGKGGNNAGTMSRANSMDSMGENRQYTIFSMILHSIRLHFDDYGKYPTRSLQLLWAVGFILILVTERLDRVYNLHDQISSNGSHNQYHHGDSSSSRYTHVDDATLTESFMQSISVSLLVSIPIAIDAFLSFFVEQVVSQSNEREMVRNSLLLIVSLPNLLLYYKVLSPSIVDLLLFLQYLSFFQLAIFVILKISARRKIILYCSLTNITMLMIVVDVIAFYYNLACHQLIPGEIAWKAVFSSSLVCMVFYASFKIRSWITMLPFISWLINQWCGVTASVTNMRPDVKTMDTTERSVYISLSIVLGCSSLAAFANIGSFQYNYVFFPDSLQSCIAFEWYFVVMLVLASALRNFQVRKSEVHHAKQLIHNRKMTGAISHEIRTPLNTAFMALDLLTSTISAPNSSIQDPSERENLLEIAKTVKDGCDISLNILNELLTFEKLSAGMMQIEPKLAPLVSHVESNVAVFHMQARQKGIELCTAISVEDRVRFKDLHVYVDEHKMSQVARNILSNALKFTPKGGKVTVTASVEANPRFLVDLTPSLGKLSRMPSRFFGGSSRRNTATPAPFNGGDPIVPTSGTSPTTSMGDSHNIDPNGNSTRRHWYHYLFFPRSKSNDVAPMMNSQSQGKSHVETGPETTRPSSHQPVELIFHEVPGVKPYGSLKIFVTDTGPGIDKDDINKLFKEYVQINPGELQKGQGSGLGLSICKSIVQLHGGNVWVESDGKGQGCTFVVELPLYYRPSAASNAPSQVDARSIAGGGEKSGGLSMRSVMPWRNAFIGGGLISRGGSERAFSLHSAGSSVGFGMGNPTTAGSVQSNNRGIPSSKFMPMSPSGVGSSTAGMPMRSSATSTVGANDDNIEGHDHYDEENQHAANIEAPPVFLPISPPSSYASGQRKRFIPTTPTDSDANVAIVIQKDDKEAPVTTNDLEDHNSHSTVNTAMTNNTGGGGAVGGVVEVTTSSTTMNGAIIDSFVKKGDIKADSLNTTPRTTTVVRRTSASSVPSSPSRTGVNAAVLGAGSGVHSNQTSTKNTNTSNSISFNGSSAMLNSNAIISAVMNSQNSTLRAAAGPSHSSTASLAQQPPASAGLPSFTFLVVDDSAANRKMLSRLLQRDGYQVVEADDGTTAVDIMQKMMKQQRRPSFINGILGKTSNAATTPEESVIPRIDIILIDFFMKKMNGPDAVKKIRKQGFTGPIIGVTGLVDEDCDVFIKQGADMVLCKPVSVAGIWKALNSMGYIV